MVYSSLLELCGSKQYFKQSTNTRKKIIIIAMYHVEVVLLKEWLVATDKCNVFVGANVLGFLIRSVHIQTYQMRHYDGISNKKNV